MAQATVKIRVEGRVQGVGYRAWTAETARKTGLTGWVRNRKDGSVEALLAGTQTQVENMIAACWEGPPAAQVEAVVRQPAEENPAMPGFIIMPTV